MNCKQVIEFLADYLNGDLTLPATVVFKLHLAMCRHCRNYLASYEETLKLARTTENVEFFQATAPVPESLIQSILATQKLLGTQTPPQTEP